MKKVLMVALELPPCRSAGVQRTLRFSEYLTDFLWQPYIITATDNIHERRDDALTLTPEVAQHMVKAKCSDAAKKYAIKGRYFQWMTLPDRYWPWYFDAVRQASRVIERESPNVIWSTYPVLTAHWIARKLQKKYNIPWVVDFRDPLQCRYDKSAQRYAWLKKSMEKSVIKRADKVVFTSERAASLYRDLYSNEDPNKFITIENGYYLNDKKAAVKVMKRDKFQLLYSGALYVNGRDPKQLFIALSKLKKQGVISPNNFILTFRAGKTEIYKSLLAELNITELIESLPATTFDEALVEMKHASATLLIQDEIFHRQIPGKIYDYISVKRPILAITPQNSATADLIAEIPFGVNAWGAEEIAKKVQMMLGENIDCSANVEQYSRKRKTKELVDVFNTIIDK